MRTLIIAPNWIGDAVMAQPLVALLARPGADDRIDVLAPPHVAPVFRAMEHVHEVIVAANAHGRLQFGARWRLARSLRGRRYDRCVVLPNSMKSALVPFLAGIPERIGHRGENRYLLINRMHDAAPGARPPMVEFYARLAFPPGTPMPPQVPNPVLRHDVQRKREVLERLGLQLDDPLVVLCPGAEYGEAKRWPARHVAALAALVAIEWPEATIVLLGSAKERPMATEIAALSGHELHNLCGETTLDEAIALIGAASGVVSNDSGLMHVAAALARPQVAVFGSSDPRHTPPRSPRARVEWLHLECSPCFERTCPLGHLNCLNQISPAAVFDALKKAMRFETATRPPR
ncbi:MAG TPA: lipopolysaccharide heptosyltransferase II [Quisquiliibacterium sp.]|nr:lipopolysaccharide heptosyltransferase II [Quisquiliibacterium sp.]HPA88227.1 lipopolysaccharide heptosyltransferase II [Quisquiliibacterium sp.]HQD82858.1 lipopolysaccharide heptosyltransferase II [Quisquiliibacterium sp.]HQN12742.1 lipopolysaccharide heptosyltransferase II [Quisquiliibacterium sp.]HQP66510.1 lipopolysaccharide heptosyltransferase II [Quisquiliibacterium sp.]